MRAIRVEKLIVLKAGCRDDECCNLVARLGGQVVKRIPFVGAVAVSRLSEEAVRALATHRDVETVEDDLPVYALGAAAGLWGRTDVKARRPKLCWPEPRWPDRGRTGRRLAPRIPWGVRRIGAPAVWPESRGRGVTIAIVDTGIDLTHPDLQERVVGGFSSVGGTCNDENGHGTHVAGIAAASGVDGGVLGVAPQANLLAVKVLDARGAGTLTSLLEGLAWVAKVRAPIVNLSLGSPIPSRLVRRAVTRLAEAGALVIAAAGNMGPEEGSVGYPAGYPCVTAVGALTPGGEVAPFSSRGEGIDLVAPGARVLSTWLGGEYRRLDGTSMAAPHAAGAAALLWPFLGDAHAVRRALLNGASPLCDWPRSAQGWGALSAVSAVAWALGQESHGL